MAKAAKKKQETGEVKYTWEGDAQITLKGAEFEAIINLFTVLTSDGVSEYTRNISLYETSKIFPPIFGRLIEQGIVKEVKS